MACPIRLHPLRKPPNHLVPIPRWQLCLPEEFQKVFTTYLGIQQHDVEPQATISPLDVVKTVQEWLHSNERHVVSEPFHVIEGHDTTGSTVWVCYWTDTAAQDPVFQPLDLAHIYRTLNNSDSKMIGVWQESFATDVCRLETNYSDLDYLPGLARLPGAKTEEHTLSTYWGAARDRVPDSAHDLFPRSEDIKRPSTAHSGLGEHLVGTNHNNMVHIRSGQWWADCGQQEADAYEMKLEPTLRAGLQYLCENSEQTGVMGLRYLRNSSRPGEVDERGRKESCGAGFFANFEDLENWAKSHPSHLKIWRGALAHYKEFGEYRRFQTWHEVCVIREGDAKFEYINCAPGTGVMRSIQLYDKRGGLASFFDRPHLLVHEACEPTILSLLHISTVFLAIATALAGQQGSHAQQLFTPQSAENSNPDVASPDASVRSCGYHAIITEYCLNGSPSAKLQVNHVDHGEDKAAANKSMPITELSFQHSDILKGPMIQNKTLSFLWVDATRAPYSQPEGKRFFFVMYPDMSQTWYDYHDQALSTNCQCTSMLSDGGATCEVDVDEEILGDVS